MNPTEKTIEPPAESPRQEDGKATITERPREINGPRGPEPTRYGDWERKGRCVDF
ncbi:MAG: succinate dehydrogenase assembly factor 4 [Gammaproteobacteria bacterium]